MSGITIGRFRGGLCVYWYEQGQRKRYQLASRTRADAESEALDVYRKNIARPVEATVQTIWTDYVAHLGTKPTAKTMGYTGKAVLPVFGSYRPDQITSDMCRQYAASRMKTGRSQGTVWTELGHLRSALHFAASAGIIARAPHVERPSKPTPPDRWLTADEIRALLDAAEAPHIHLAIHLLIATAARIGAILDLEWSRVDLERRIINLRLPDSVTRKGRAVVPINAGLCASLQMAREAALSDFVVEYAGGRVRSIRTGFSAACRRAGIAGVTIHTLRHSAAVHMVSEGIPIEKVAQFLGHSNTAITYSTYARYAPGHLQDAADVLDFTRIRGVK